MTAALHVKKMAPKDSTVVHEVIFRVFLRNYNELTTFRQFSAGEDRQMGRVGRKKRP